MPGKSKRPWRKDLKKQQRKRRRRKAAVARDLRVEEDEASKLKDPAYQLWLQQQSQLEEEQLRAAEKRHAEEEETWLRRDLLAQREFRLKQQQREAAEAAERAKRKQQAEELAAKEAEQRRRREERERSEAAAAAEFEQMLQCTEKFLNTDGPAPAELRRVVESRPGQNLCILYDRTNCCRFGPSCANNHRRPLLSNIIVVRHFFMHPLLEQEEHKEYATADGGLELSEQDLREAYVEFFDDVIPELQGFGYLRNFRTVRNVLRHLRGHVFVEYLEERSALKAFIKLQGRFYAGRQLNVEFSSIQNWRGAICGLSHAHKCPKGDKCNYLHLFKNPGNKYNTPLVAKKTPSGRVQVATPLISWNMVTANDVKHNSRNWRWSESPEIEVAATRLDPEKTEKKVSKSDDCRRHKNDDKLKNSTHTQTKNEDVDGKSKRKRKKHKHERDKSHKKHKRKRSRSSKHSEKHQDRQNDSRTSDNKHSKSKYDHTTRSCTPSAKSDDGRQSKSAGSESSRSARQDDDKGQHKNGSDKCEHSTAEERHTKRKYHKSSSSDSFTPKKDKSIDSNRSRSKESPERRNAASKC
ncbi:U2 small nuclear ribonucleoprotein auxiliary factor 35 kDa subunit-related protein 1-like isoform X2 [Rhagoletis pomonella]|uniref:U2 small nuclear ribonucleoprotein auxiliary factor 35 kDa subunit-related protein 1-like isoform X2 n=1 Tax=Rhagoletis pomonella TaxID=28610 RepID=UPI00177AB0E5|nr:U2 small nuclear ribonucleoprotein auxiliary factor 35 kDa subunit-related protein 1-like isoform X2 [Rhagoletis pomonella]